MRLAFLFILIPSVLFAQTQTDINVARVVKVRVKADSTNVYNNLVVTDSGHFTGTVTVAPGNTVIGNANSNQIAFPTGGTDGSEVSGTGTLYERAGAMSFSSPADMYFGIDNDNGLSDAGNDAYRWIRNTGGVLAPADSAIMTLTDLARLGVGPGNTAPALTLTGWGTASTLGFNFTATDFNFTRSSVAQESDTSAISGTFSETGKPKLWVRGLAGNTVFVSDTSGFNGFGLSDPLYTVDINGTFRAVLGSSVMTISDVTTDATNKFLRMGSAHYTNSEEPAALFIGNNTSTNNEIRYGGSSALVNATTLHRWYAAANNTTTTGTEFMRGTLTGLYIGPASMANPSVPLDVLAADNGTAVEVTINATQANVTASDIYMDFRSTSGSEGTIAGTAVAGVLAYNTFTGAHYTQKQNDSESMVVGMIVSATGNVMPGGDYLPTVTRTTGRNDRGAYGVYSGKIADGFTQVEIDSLRAMKRAHDSTQTLYDARKARADSLGEVRLPVDAPMSDFDALAAEIAAADSLLRTTTVSPLPTFRGHTLEYAKGNPRKDLHQVFAVGTGVILVTDAGGNIAVGDFIASSPTRGLGERQTIGGLGVSADPVEYSYTVAKATVAVDFSTVPVHPQLGVKVKLIPCTYAF